MDRRDFLKQSGGSVGGFLVNPTVGLLSALAFGTSNPGLRKNTAKSVGSERKRPILRTGEPINTAGTPYPGQIRTMQIIAMPDVLPKGRIRAVVVAGHADQSISLIEVAREPKGWRHQVASHVNRILAEKDSVPFEGGRLMPDAPAYWERKPSQGVGQIQTSIALAWQNVLIASDWIIEVNPLKGYAIKRFSLAKTNPIALSVRTQAGKPLEVYQLSETGHLFKFVSHQRFDGRQLTANTSILAIGELYVAHGHEKKWVSLTEGLTPAQWADCMQNPFASSKIPQQPFGEKPIALQSSEHGVVVKFKDSIQSLREEDANAFSIQDSKSTDSESIPLALTVSAQAEEYVFSVQNIDQSASILMVSEPEPQQAS